MNKSVILGFLALALSSTTGCSEKEPGTEGKPSRATQAWKEIEKLYEKAKEAGDTTPGDVVDWAKRDIQRIGDWEYRVVTVATAGDDVFEKRFNELGRDRWEIFWVERFQEGNLRLFLKRPARSYLKLIPLSDLSKLVPGGGDGQ